MSGKKSKGKKSISPSLPSETINEIFKKIDNQSTLYSCLFVNRFWCRSVVPILWAKPNPLLFKTGSSKSLIESYVSCFNQDERRILFSNDELSSVDDDFLHLPSPLFEYAAFLKELNYPVLRKAVRKCYKTLGNYEFSKKIKPKIPGLEVTRQATIMKALCKLFMRSSHLDSVILDSIDDIPAISIFTRSPSLANLSQLVVLINNESSNTSILVKKLSVICTGIRHLKIELSVDDPSEAENLSTLIRAQQSLLTFELTGFAPRINPILSALESQSSSLTFVKFNNTNYQWASLDVLGKCTNLRTIEFHSEDQKISQELTAKEITSTTVSGVSFSLRTLKLINQTPKVASAVIKTGGSSLKSLWINTINTEVVQAILRSTTRIVHLYLDVADIPEINIDNYLQLIHGLKLINLRLSSINMKNLDALLTAMVKIVPSSLRHFELEQDYSLPALGEFLSNCPVPFNELSLFPNAAIDTEYLTTVLSFTKERKSLKYLHLNLSWEYGLATGKFTRDMDKEIQQCIYTINLDLLRCDYETPKKRIVT
ncbi:4560_t:CDS:1 [Cetraspora pellucida]|uniref:4560_t:CDS:1 n=1 Tax=Cetraspora pellucida TaxID=1433469 RepID=A0A9N9C1U7_9GLOM|nr:4560_t:CDS:1 [Cetraspora pellucida]